MKLGPKGRLQNLFEQIAERCQFGHGGDKAFDLLGGQRFSPCDYPNGFFTAVRRPFERVSTDTDYRFIPLFLYAYVDMVLGARRDSGG